jgi:hypothetical protein
MHGHQNVKMTAELPALLPCWTQEVSLTFCKIIMYNNKQDNDLAIALAITQLQFRSQWGVKHICLVQSVQTGSGVYAGSSPMFTRSKVARVYRWPITFSYSTKGKNVRSYTSTPPHSMILD